MCFNIQIVLLDPLLLELEVMETRQQLEELQRQHTNLQSEHNEMKMKVEGMLGAQRLMEECLNDLLCQFNTFPRLNYGATVHSFGTTSPGLSPGVLPFTGLNCTSNYPSTSYGPSISDTSTPARTYLPNARARLPRTQLHFMDPESLQTPPIQPPSIQAPPTCIQVPSIQAPSIQAPSIQSPTPSPAAANQLGPANYQTPPQPLLPTRQNTAKCLDSCEIRKELLRPVDEVLFINAKYRVLSKASTLAVKLAKEAFFGDNVLVRCTVAGGREFPGLPQKEMQELKGVMLRQFPQFWQAPVQFELTWKDCCESIGQACKRLRDKHKNVQ